MRFHLRQRKQRDLRPRLPSDDVAWIGENRRPFGGYAVGSLVPMVFDHYARILHPAWAPSDKKDEPVRWGSVAAWSGRAVHALAQWESLSDPVTMPSRPPPFVAPPDTDGLPPASLASLCDVLDTHTRTPDDCFIGVWEGYGWPVEAWAGSGVLDLENRSYLVRRGPLALARTISWRPFPDRLLVEPPNLVWPADRAWFVASDTDLDSTYLGGSAALIAGLVAHEGLEAWPIDAADLITIDSDRINGRSP
jgi:hypothetical protein